MSTTSTVAGAENVRWDLNCLYRGVDDPKLEEDLKTYEKEAQAFNREYKGRLTEKLGWACEEYGRLSCMAEAPGAFLFFKFSCDTADTAVESRMNEVGQRLSLINGEWLTFFELEIIALPDFTIASAAKSDPRVAKHLPWIERVRKYRPHVFDEKIESALTKRGPYASGSWGEFHDKVESMLRFTWDGEEQTLNDMLHHLQEEATPERRADVLKTINDGFRGFFAEYSAQALYVTAGAKSVEDKERGYPHSMSSRNMGNDVSDAAVEALHAAASEVGAPLAARYYRLKAEMLGLPKLRWSDRNAKLPFEDAERMPFEEAKQVVRKAYRSFSPTLADIVDDLFARGRVDAPGLPNRRGGAYDASIILPDGTPESFVFMNYKGSRRDVATLAHELGHAVHGILAAKAQGPLMFSAPMAYAETASIFGERVTFEDMKAQLEAKGDTKALLALICGVLDDTMNTVIRQISFSEFERLLHAAGGRKLSVEELSKNWLQVSRRFYGDAFIYEDMDLMWAYIGHFYRPYYVYSYAYAKLFVDAIYGCKDRLGDRFEPLYLDILRAGGTKSGSELVEPLGLDPEHPRFWADGIKSSLEPLIETAERLFRGL